MIININGLFLALSFALDSVEGELVGVSTGHSKRVAYLCTVLGKGMGMTDAELADLSICAVMHDNALTQYLAEEYLKNTQDKDSHGEIIFSHCVRGEENMQHFPFLHNCKDVVLYHHETADGSGPFGKKEDEVPLGAQLIHLADILDQKCRLSDAAKGNYEQAVRYLNENKGTLYPARLVEAFENSFDEKCFAGLEKEQIDDRLAALIPDRTVDYTRAQIGSIVDVFAKIIDYKSEFTKNHSLGIAQKAEQMGKIYGYDDEICIRLYVAGAMHDIGKLAIHNRVLEKPNQLSDEEFSYMKEHAWYTWKILSNVKGFEDITKWASRHHEKLNGTGYPFGLMGEELDEKDRLLACLDIYQALTEPRPYKAGMPHEKAMDILYHMTQQGMIDKKITKDIDRIYGAKTVLLDDKETDALY